ncbi:Tetratricopeptide repeat-containing protein [Evansella caseinilytica]|uniref:Tetratricopeptide repeat-containing protein n=1 Tax=Evansella caseinilytica TaxID=1503961 RepID=A0A1H3S9C1_9BACI|nr:tetratricopeptide repeat protein [Evansella caseinilytica]SDZ34693.1 Tetratricopeptide repeat-containing protein [Evansella caseinilytica]
MRELYSKQKKGQVIPFLQNGAYFYRKGIKAYQNHHIEKAIKYIEKAMLLEPEEPVFVCQLAIVLSEKGQYEEANNLLEQVINDLDESLSECYFFMANNFAHLGRFDAAKTLLTKYLELDPEGEFAEDANSLLYVLEEESAFLVEDGSPSTDTPTNIEAIVDSLNKGDFAGAENDARVYLTKNPHDWDVYAYLAESLIMQERLPEAKAILSDLLIKEEPNFLAQCLMTYLLEKQGDENSRMWIKNLSELHPLKDWHCYYLAKVLFLVKEYGKSYKWYQKLFRDSDFRKFPAFYHQMAMTAWKTGHRKKAVELWERTDNMEAVGSSPAGCFLELIATADETAEPADHWFIYKAPPELGEPAE